MISWSWPVDISSSVRNKPINQGVSRVFLMAHFSLRMMSHHPCSWSKVCWLPDGLCAGDLLKDVRWKHLKTASHWSRKPSKPSKPSIIIMFPSLDILVKRWWWKIWFRSYGSHHHSSIFSIHHHFPIIFPSTKSLHQDSSVGGPPPNPWAQLNASAAAKKTERRIYIRTTRNHPEKV